MIADLSMTVGFSTVAGLANIFSIFVLFLFFLVFILLIIVVILHFRDHTIVIYLRLFFFIFLLLWRRPVIIFGLNLIRVSWLASQVLLELREAPHIAWNLVLDTFVFITAPLRNRVIGQVGKEIRRVSRVVVLADESDVTFFEDIDLQRIPVGDYHPHSDVQLAVHDQKRVLDILLNYPSFLRVNIHGIVYLLARVDVVLLACTASIIS